MKRKSRTPEAKLKDKLWELCKNIIRKRHGNTCYTCGKPNLEGVNWQTGHMWPKGALGYSLKYDLRILRPQCYNCNMNLGGMGAIFYRNMENEMGRAYMLKLEKERVQDRKAEVKADRIWFENKINSYQAIFNELPNDSLYVSII